ncbi:MAG: murein L,D-transpeptidase catalytic domain-containing protein [Kofleriaceae bacterium]
MRIAIALVALAGCSPERECSEGCIDDGPWSGSGSTSDGRAELAGYACGGALNGREYVHRIAVSRTGFVAAEIDEASGAEVRLLRELAADACIDGAGRRAGALVEPGAYWVVVDTESGREGPFQLRIGFTDPEDLVGHGIADAVAADALDVIGAGWRRDTTRFEYVIADFSLHSSVPREWIVNLATEELLWNVHVAHGRGFNDAFVNTGFAPAFSNTPESHLSSYGVMRSAEAYVGMYGSSYRIDGLEPDINHNVRPRDIVMHPWEGSRPEFIATKGETQPTWGCPAIDDRIAPLIADATSGGVLMFFWHPEWRGRSQYLP